MPVLRAIGHSVTLSRVLLVVVLANYLAQVAYYLDLYAPSPPAWAGTVVLGLTLLWFLAGSIFDARGLWAGRLLMVTYLIAMSGFYVVNLVNQVRHGFGPLWHLQHHDLLIKAVFAIGYLNMVVGAVALVFVLLRPDHLSGASGHLETLAGT